MFGISLERVEDRFNLVPVRSDVTAALAMPCDTRRAVSCSVADLRIGAALRAAKIVARMDLWGTNLQRT